MVKASAVEGEASGSERAGFPNMFVLVALVTMLLGTMLILAAREPSSAEVPAGQEVEVFRFEAPTWDPFNHPMKATLTTNQSFNITAAELTGTGKGDSEEFHEVNGTTVTWRADAEPGEVWTVTVRNAGNESILVATLVSDNVSYVGGGVLVGVGVLGFVSYRMGMRRA